jgi:hypothetical protein
LWFVVLLERFSDSWWWNVGRMDHRSLLGAEEFYIIFSIEQVEPGFVARMFYNFK